MNYIGPKVYIDLTQLVKNYYLLSDQVGNIPIMATVKANGYSRYRKSISCLLSYTIPKDREKDAAFLGKLSNKVEAVNLRHQALDDLITNSYNNLAPNKVYNLIKQYKDIVV